MKKMFQENDLALEHDAKIREIMRIWLNINNIRKFELKEHLRISQGRKGAELLLNHELRRDLFAKLGLIPVFENEVFPIDQCRSVCPI